MKSSSHDRLARSLDLIPWLGTTSEDQQILTLFAMYHTDTSTLSPVSCLPVQPVLYAASHR